MPFKPPIFDILSEKVARLTQDYSNKLKRYTIPCPDGVKTTLDALIIRINGMKDFHSDRVNELKAITAYVNKVRDTRRDDPVAVENATMLLLGVLICHYLYRIKRYTDRDKSWGYSFASTVSLGFWESDLKECRLFKAIRFALDLPAELTKDFKRVDLERLDKLTILTSLENYLNNILGDLPFYKEAPELKPFLDELVKSHKKDSATKTLLSRYAALAFIQSLANLLQDERVKLAEALTTWSKKAGSKYSTPLKREMLDSLLVDMQVYVTEPQLQNHISYLLRSKSVKCLLEKEISFTSLLKKLQELNEEKSSYALLGAVILILKNETDPLFVSLLKDSVGMAQLLHELDDSEKLLPLLLLSQFIEVTGGKALDMQYFDNFDSFKTRLALDIQELRSAVETAARMATALVPS